MSGSERVLCVLMITNDVIVKKLSKAIYLTLYVYIGILCVHELTRGSFSTVVKSRTADHKVEQLILHLGHH